jgi:hypothetical protein
MLAYGEWLEDNVLAPVPHRQYVFALPNLIRPFFRHRRRYLGGLCRLVAALLKIGFKAMAPHGQPAFVLYVKTFGDLVTFNPHIHALVANGVFLPSGTFQVLPALPENTLCEALRHNVLAFLSAEGVLDAGLAETHAHVAPLGILGTQPYPEQSGRRRRPAAPRPLHDSLPIGPREDALR